ncbi:MAG: hypothetical protein AB7I59_18265 [Geminicoccaceae bacterium]
MPPIQPHTYEEVRDVVVDVLHGGEQTQYGASQFESLKLSVREVFARRAGQAGQASLLPRNPQDDELVRDVFWDLFRQGAITLGLDNVNPNWPFFRLSYFGARTIGSQSPWRFHDTSSYLAVVRREAPDISDQAAVYLDEAVQAFYAQCLLASSVMLGVAAEAEFLRLLDVAATRPTVGSRFASAMNEKFVRQKIAKFLPALTAIASRLDRQATEDLETNFAPIQSVLRIARNEAGHPRSTAPHRENVYVNLQLFIPFARQLMRLRNALIAHDPDS